MDGLGLLLGAELVRRAGLSADEAPGDHWREALAALRSLVEDPTVSEGTMREGAREAARAEKAAQLRKALREPLEKRLTLVTNQLADVARAEAGLDSAAQDRTEADLLMAYAHTVEGGAPSALLPAFDGSGEVPVSLDPQLSAVQNAEKRYARARRREEVYERLAGREPTLLAELEEARERLAQLDAASLEELEALSQTLQAERPEKSPYGLRFTTPGGFEALVGRNNKENATLTHRVGRSLDYWFHAQGYPGSHVLVRTGARTSPCPTSCTPRAWLPPTPRRGGAATSRWTTPGSSSCGGPGEPPPGRSTTPTRRRSSWTARCPRRARRRGDPPHQGSGHDEDVAGTETPRPWSTSCSGAGFTARTSPRRTPTMWGA